MPIPIRALPAMIASCAAVLALVPSCSTDPVNPDGCRSIEEARCQAAPACAAYSGLDVSSCKRFYRDQCLHGLASVTDPGQPSIDLCVRTINAAGTCASSGENPCSFVPYSDADPCDVIQYPERYTQCAFLVPPAAPTPEAGPEAQAEAAAD